MKCEMLSGDHICVSRGNYWHHGLYVGKSEVIQFGSNINQQEQVVEKVSIKQFSMGNSIRLGWSPSCFSPTEIVNRAYDSLGLNGGGYHVLKNNCEHFVSWCRTGQAHSEQVWRAKWAYLKGTGTVGILSQTAPIRPLLLHPALKIVSSFFGPLGVIAMFGATVGTTLASSAVRNSYLKGN